MRAEPITALPRPEDTATVPTWGDEMWAWAADSAVITTATALTAALAQLAADTRQRAEALAARIWGEAPDGHTPTCFIDNLDLAVTLLRQLADMATAGDLYQRDDWFERLLAQHTGTTALDSADPEDSELVDQLIAEYAAA